MNMQVLKSDILLIAPIAMVTAGLMWAPVSKKSGKSFKHTPVFEVSADLSQILPYELFFQLIIFNMKLSIKRQSYKYAHIIHFLSLNAIKRCTNPLIGAFQCCNLDCMQRRRRCYEVQCYLY